MSLNAMHINVMVFSDSQEKAINKMNELVSDKEIIKRNKDFVVTKDRTYQAKGFSDSCRGYRYREVYVDETLRYDQEIMFLIRTKLMPPHYYNGYEYDDNYNWKDYVHYF